MAICKLCGRDMHIARSCIAEYIFCNGEKYKRQRFGREGWDELLRRCPDCNTLYGHLHHWGCDIEQCPACGLQLLDCECEDVYIETEGSDSDG